MRPGPTGTRLVTLRIDGTEGGGQLLRTALSLAVVTDTPFRIDHVRGARPTPGLRPQHLAAVTLAAECCEATVRGAELGSPTLTFRPGASRTRTLTAAVATAGSVTLLFDTLLPIAVLDDGPYALTATGGTDVKWAPTVAYYRHVKLPLLARFGVDAGISLGRTGYYPAGGGRATLSTGDSSLAPVELTDRGVLDRVDIYSKAAAVLEDRSVAARQATQASDRLAAAGFSAEVRAVEYAETHSAGSSLLLCGVYEGTRLGVDALGERGRTSEAVADGAVDRFLTAHENGAPVDEHMGDQLLVFLALAGGRLRVPRVTSHVRTNVDVLRRFGADIGIVGGEDGPAVVEASPHPAVSR
ncbi:RNA 3'-terminal phosphate cyclase [Haloarcula marina]|uniref:RNA 3'-terminal phosphate cyclase n=1 Tax=Haloarcula marina TaxID=2961574 RepID=UPI0020B7C445|nr:RNA 3'-terminal phosphate cyclase [Halomicroarcula marina]